MINYIDVLNEALKICSPYTSCDEKAKEAIKLAIERSNYSDIQKSNMKVILDTAHSFNEFCTNLGQYAIAFLF